MNNLVKFTSTSYHQARDWLADNDQDRRLRAVKAVSTRDHRELWSLTRAYLFLHGAKGGKVSRHTLKAYRRGVLDLLNAWRNENLLRPGADAGVLYVRMLETQANPSTGRPLSPTSVEVKLAAARTLYKALRWVGATEAAPFENVRPAPDPTPRWEKRRPYSPDDVDSLLALAEPAEAAALLLGAHAGLRIGEMTALRWADIDWQARKLLVSGKGGKRSRVSISRRLERVLLQLRSEPRRPRRRRSEVLVLPWGDERLRQRLRALCARAGVAYSKRAVHGLRHGAGTRYYAQTGDLGRVAAHLRHENIQTTRVYAKLADGAVARDIEDW